MCSVSTPYHMTLGDSLLARQESVMRWGQEDRGSGKAIKVGLCCSLGLSSSRVVHFHLPLLPLGFSLFHIGGFFLLNP